MKLDKVVMDAIYETRWKTMYHAECYIGLDPEFMAKAHLLIPEGEENILYNWMLNFQYMSDEYVKMYKNSKPIADGNEPDIYIFSDPQWVPGERPDVDYSCLSDPLTLCYFDTNANCAAILGMRYFGEHKKGTLTMAWALLAETAMLLPRWTEEILTSDGSNCCIVYGLSGSGKFINTCYMAENMKSKFFMTMLSLSTQIHVLPCFKPTYFDKTADTLQDVLITSICYLLRTALVQWTAKARFS